MRDTTTPDTYMSSSRRERRSGSERAGEGEERVMDSKQEREYQEILIRLARDHLPVVLKAINRVAALDAARRPGAMTPDDAPLLAD